MRAVVLALAIATLLVFLALAALLVQVLRTESAAWRTLLASAVTGPVVVELRHAGGVQATHALDAGVFDPLRRLVRVATMGREEVTPGRRARGSQDPEAVARARIREESVAGLALRLQGMYRAQGDTRSLDACAAEALAMFNGAGELAG